MYVPVYVHVCVRMCLGKWEWPTRVCGRVYMSWRVIVCRCAQASLHVFAALWTVSEHVLGLRLPSWFDLCPGPWLSCGLGGPPAPLTSPFSWLGGLTCWVQRGRCHLATCEGCVKYTPVLRLPTWARGEEIMSIHLETESLLIIIVAAHRLTNTFHNWAIML